jgi:hypothetical protein
MDEKLLETLTDLVQALTTDNMVYLNLRSRLALSNAVELLNKIRKNRIDRSTPNNDQGPLGSA